MKPGDVVWVKATVTGWGIDCGVTSKAEILTAEQVEQWRKCALQEEALRAALKALPVHVYGMFLTFQQQNFVAEFLKER
jgi:hypothetical protein